MSALVLGAVLFAAVLHGTWNAIAKAIPDRLVSAALIGVPNLLLGCLGALVFPLPAAASWPWLLGSVVLQTVSLILLTAAYARTEFGRAYPLARGFAVVCITATSVVLLGERLSSGQLLGVATVVGALAALALANGLKGARAGLGLVLGVGVTIAGYSVLGGVGVRLSGTVLGYASWLFALHGLLLPLLTYALSSDRRRFRALARRHAPLGLAGGTLAVLTYGIVVWAQSQAPLALVSALRETGVVAAGLVGWLVFKERLRPLALVGAAVAVVGIALLRLG